jgi:hypothetical protein
MMGVTDPTWDAVILSCAAVAAAGIAAWTANSRIDKQLAAESERLDKQLAHDRYVREAEELRRLIDEAAAAGLAAGNAINPFRNQLRWILDEGELNDMYYAKLRAARNGIAGLQGFTERFDLRLGKGNEVSAACSDWQLGQEQAMTVLEEHPLTTETLRKGGELFRNGKAQYLSFMESAAPYVRLDRAENAGEQGGTVRNGGKSGDPKFRRGGL